MVYYCVIFIVYFCTGLLYIVESLREKSWHIHTMANLMHELSQPYTNVLYKYACAALIVNKSSSLFYSANSPSANNKTAT